jgi:hypothetical protein
MGSAFPRPNIFFKCEACGGYFDARDLVWFGDHEGPLPHPARKMGIR